MLTLFFWMFKHENLLSLENTLDFTYSSRSCFCRDMGQCRIYKFNNTIVLHCQNISTANVSFVILCNSVVQDHEQEPPLASNEITIKRLRNFHIVNLLHRNKNNPNPSVENSSWKPQGIILPGKFLKMVSKNMFKQL